MRMRLMLVCAALALTVGVTAGAGWAAPATPLDGEELFSVLATNDYSNCVDGAGGPVSFGVASGVVSGVAPPYPGTFTASGSATLDASAGVVTALNGTFTIHDATDGVDISGTLSLVGSSGSATCGEFTADVIYQATITTPEESCVDTGTVTLNTNDASVFDLYSFSSVSLICVVSAQKLIQDTSDQLKLLAQLQSMKPAEKLKIQDASDTLALVAASTAWITSLTLDAQTGATVFNGIQKAMADTSAAAKLEKELAIQNQLTDAKEMMRDATVSIADTAIQQGVAMLATVPADVALKAEQDLKMGQKFLQKVLEVQLEALKDSSSWVSQIQMLQKAWAEAQKALAIMNAA